MSTCRVAKCQVFHLPNQQFVLPWAVSGIFLKKLDTLKPNLVVDLEWRMWGHPDVVGLQSQNPWWQARGEEQDLANRPDCYLCSSTRCSPSLTDEQGCPVVHHWWHHNDIRWCFFTDMVWYQTMQVKEQPTKHQPSAKDWVLQNSLQSAP